MQARFSALSLRGAFYFLGVAWCACGGAQTPPAAETSPAASAAPRAPAETASATAAESAKPASDAAPKNADAGDAAKPAAKSEPDPNATREVTYVVVPEGLKITVAGVKFIASAVAEQTGGGWGAKINVEASSDDGKAHSLTKPKAGPLAFAGSVMRKGKSEPDHFGDERSGDGDEAVSPDKPNKFSRTWPIKGVRALAIGDALDLQVALWGLGDTTDVRRPVKQFFHVRMQVDKGKPKAIVEPPASAAGK
ncbi:MAG TPA: hypothetical protein VGM44_02310 [Polyangiaceae bacterium]|jgi:hypothetical protein